MAKQSTCPHCGEQGNRVIDSRTYEKMTDITRRRRKCNSCGERFSTLEIPIEFPQSFKSDVHQSFAQKISDFLTELDRGHANLSRNPEALVETS